MYWKFYIAQIIIIEDIDKILKGALEVFLSVVQECNESLDDWSDRIMVLAVSAFRELPSSYATQQGVLRFCYELYDQEVAMHVSMKRL